MAQYSREYLTKTQAGKYQGCESDEDRELVIYQTTANIQCAWEEEKAIASDETMVGDAFENAYTVPYRKNAGIAHHFPQDK